jgi:hypothetical protein
MPEIFTSIKSFTISTLIAFCLQAFTGCTKSVEIKLRETDSKVKVFGVFEYGKPVQVRLSYTTFLTDEKLENPISGANISLYHQNRLVVLFKPEEQGLYLSDFTAYSPGDTVLFKLAIDHLIVSSQTEIPYPLKNVTISLDTIPKTRPGIDCAMDFTLTFQDTAGVDNYYEVEIWFQPISDRIHSDFLLHPVRSDDPVITGQAYAQPLSFFTGSYAVSLPFTDQSFDGQERSIKFSYQPSYGAGNISGIPYRRVSKHRIIIVFKSITHSYYDYRTSVVRHLLAREADEFFGSSTPVPIVGNISGGVGIFACQQSISDTLTVNQISF